MKSYSTLIAILGLSISSLALAQNQGRASAGLPPGMSLAQPSELLPENYRLTFSGQSGEKRLGELSTLTCSPQITITGTLVPEEIPVIFTVSGTLAEKDGVVTFVYSIGFRIPIPAQTSQAGKDGERTVTNIVYQDQQCSGALRMKPGRSYELLKAGGTTYVVTIAAEPDK